MKIDLDFKPCPFCGSDNLTVDVMIEKKLGYNKQLYLTVNCLECGTKVNLKQHDCYFQYKDKTPIDIWNMRTEVE